MSHTCMCAQVDANWNLCIFNSTCPIYIKENITKLQAFFFFFLNARQKKRSCQSFCQILLRFWHLPTFKLLLAIATIAELGELEAWPHEQK